MENNLAKPVALVIFGITGDLAQRKLLPALINLIKADLLPKDSHIIGVTRQSISKNDVLKPVFSHSASKLKANLRAVNHFKQKFSLFQMDMSKENDYLELKNYLDSLDKEHGLNFQRLYYLSIPPSIFDNVVNMMGKSGLQNPCGKDNLLPSLLIEKPFGYDLDSAKQLINVTMNYFKESQVYRIDHYLAKEMAQNILSFRFLNPLFASVWGSKYISSVTITAYEDITIENRANFYEQTGALRDLIQSHLLQLMTLIATERPDSIQDSKDVHLERLKVLKAINIPKPNEVSKIAKRGQYDSYKNDVNNQKSEIETYASVDLSIDNQRWKGTKFKLRTGKAMDKKSTRIDIQFGPNNKNNLLSLQLQPDEGIFLDLQVKKPGHEREIKRMQMDFSYKRTFKGIDSPEAYERVLLDAVRQDQSLFATSDEVLASWKIIDPILSEWSKTSTDLQIYKKGSSGLKKI